MVTDEKRTGWAVVGIVIVLAFPALAFGPLAVVGGNTAVTHSSVGAMFTTSNSTNWAGYAITAAKNSVSFVNASWIVPTTVAKCTGTGQDAAFWVGIDGYSSRTVEQTGTDSHCAANKASYYAWYEFYPKGSVPIKSVPVAAGNTIYASVSYSSSTGKFTTFIADRTTGKSFSTSASVSGAARSSAERIAEAPSSFTGVLPLTDFGTVGFGYDHTGLIDTGSATIGSTTGLMGAFSAFLITINMINSAHTTLKASTSAVSADKTSFTVVWKSKGP